MPRVAVRLAVWAGGAALLAGLAAPVAVFAQAQAGPYGAEAVKALEQKKKEADAATAARAQAGGTGAQPRPAPTVTAPPATVPPAAAPAPPGAERDPFDPLVAKPREGEDRPSLSGVRLVGVLWDPGNRNQVRALVETPDGLGYYLRVNEEKFGGTVVAIDRDRVRFSVREQDPGGQVRTRTVELKLSQ